MHRLTHFLFFYLLLIVLLIFFEPKHAQRRRRTEMGSKTKLKGKEEAIHRKKEGTPPLITLNLRSFFVGSDRRQELFPCLR
ncbi:uncharacterized protein DS421_18g616810 [Arachis hypogaea]|nr:uncharacterized protein DS421_18g616810 [Arachis hypogaea]